MRTENNNVTVSAETKVCKVCGRELPTSEFSRNGFGPLNTCKQCVKEAKQRTRAEKKNVSDLEKALEEAKQMRLADFSQREMLAELKRRGYRLKGTLTEVKVKNIDTDNIEV